ncbi:MAG: ADP-ribosylglycohydrolase family protein [Chloroflexi bacterium]|nr:ADP-ribosylglycohydrolase family protein [Chloroflexota bacterium]
MTSLEQTVLFKKVYGCLLGGAIGDALGGPVEGWTPERIRETYGGHLDRYVPYRRGPGYHAHFGEGDRIGAYTDDTRIKHLLCQAIIQAGGMPRPGDFGEVLARAYHHAPDEMYEGLVEEYYLKAIWGRDKVIFSGEPTNGAIMGNSPIGLLAACRPDDAYQAGFDLAFITDGYAKTSSAMMAAAVAAAMAPHPTIDGVIAAAIDAHLRFAKRREGPRWNTLEWRYDPNVKFLRQALEIVRREKDVFAIQKPLYAVLEWGHLFSEAIHTLVVPLAMFVAADGDFRQTVMGCVMYGRDNDSYASVGGALAGAFHGVEAVPAEWIRPVVDGNPETDMRALSVQMAEIIARNYEKAQAEWNAVGALI